MAWTDFAFTPATGLLDTGTYASKPATGAIARANVQAGMDQIQTFLNDTVSNLVVETGTDYTTARARNITLSTADASGGSNGEIWIKYTP